MSGAGLIEMLAARLGGRGARRAAPALREVLASAMRASRLDDPMAEGAMLSGADDMAPPMPNAIRTGPDAGPVQARLQAEGFDTSRRFYRGQSAQYDARFPEYAYLATSPEMAAQALSGIETGGALYPAYARSNLRLKELGAQEMEDLGYRPEQIARFREQGYEGAVSGDEYIVFNHGRNLRSATTGDAFSLMPDSYEPQASGLRVQRDGNRWQLVDGDQVVQQLPPGYHFADAQRALRARTAPDGGSAQNGFDTGRVVYRGLGRPYDAADGGYYQSFTSSLDDAQEYGSNVIAAHIRPGRNLALDGGGNNFNALSVEQLPSDVRARLHSSTGASATTDQIAHAAREAGYDSVTVRNVHDNRWGERPGRNTPTRTIDFVFDTQNISPLDRIPEQPASAAPAAEKVRLTDADRALLAELEDFPGSTLPSLRHHEGSWIGTSPTGEMREFFNQANAQKALDAGWTVRTAGDHLANLNRNGPNAGPAQAVGALPSATSEGVTTYRGENTHVRIQPFPRRGVTEVTWDVNGGRAPSGLADRARLEQEGIDTALRAMQQHAAQNGDVTYTVHGSNGALARRYRRMAQERAEAAGFTFEETPSGGLIFRRADSTNRSDRNALQRALRDRMNRE